MDDGDVISNLPHDLLVSILSRLTLIEAMATSVLSRRWEKLWAFYHGDIDFEPSIKVKQDGCSNYARLVDRVMNTLEQVESGGTLGSFTFRHNLCPGNARSVDRLVWFALEKRRVKSLHFKCELYFHLSGCSHHFQKYDLPPLRCFNSQQSIRNIRALTSIHFEGVNVSGQIIERFLSNCPLLQSLDLIYSPKPLTHLRVSGKTLALRRLLICDCHDLTTIELSAPNLVSLNYMGKGSTKVKFDVGNVPKLVELTIAEFSAPPVAAEALKLFTCFSRIQKLELVIFCSRERVDLTKFTTKVTSVKHLTLKIIGSCSGSVLAWTPMLKVFPLLQKFTLDMCNRHDEAIDGMAGFHETFPHKLLKEFEFVGFGRERYDIELVMRFVKNMPTVEKVTLLCDGGGFPHSDFNLKIRVEDALSFASELKQILPKEVNLVIS